MNPLTRPMFRLGGKPSADGVGITSGLNRRHYQGGEFGEKITETVEEATKKPTYGWQELMADAYRTSKGATDWRDWVNQGADRALEIQEEIKAKPGKDLEILLKAQKHGGDYYKSTRPLEIERIQEYFDQGMRLVEQYETWEDFSKSKDFSEWEFQMKRAYKGDFPSSFMVNQEINRRLEERNQVRATTGLGPLKGDKLEAFKKEQMKDIYSRYTPGLKFAHGGRVGRAYGNPPPMTENIGMTEQVDTPQGDMSMTEDVMMSDPMAAGAGNIPGPANQDPYVLLRARLPQEVPDDVVRLIAYNPDAFADFASIESQEDVISFNQKYGVELVINTDQL